MIKLNKFVLAGIAVVGGSALVVPSVFATPSMVITVGSATQSVTLQNVSSVFGAGTYAAGSGSFDGFNYGGVLVTASGSSLQTQFGSVTDTNSTPSSISFAITQSGFSTGSSSSNFRSMQISGSVTATSATSSQTADFAGMVSPSSGSSTTQDSGALALNMNPGVLPSSSADYNTGGVNLLTPSETVSITNTYSFNLDSSAMVNGGLLVTNLSTSTVVTPEPASLGLLAVAGAGALVGLRRRKPVTV